MLNHKLIYKFFTLFIPCLFLISSCETKEDSTSSDIKAIHRLTDKEIAEVSNAIKTKDAQLAAERIGLANKSLTEAPIEEPYEEYQELLEVQDLSIQIDDRTALILDQTYEENIQYLNNLHLFTAQELAAVDKLKNELLNTKNFNTSISHFESAILLLPMTNKKLQRFYNFIDGLKSMNNYDPDFFKGLTLTSKSTGGLFGSCLSASIGVGIAFVGLATIEVGSFGAATGVAVAGFIWASAEWGAACRGGKKKQYPPAIVHKYTKVEEFVTFDDEGDLNRSPILVTLSPIDL
ncbi:MAG: hypothetical protein ABI793_04295 [Flavobacterium sp.]